MALGDLVNQTKDKKKLPLVSQQIQGGSGGINTAAAGSNNIPQAGRQGPGILPPPVVPRVPIIQKDRAGGIIRDTPSFTPTRGTATPPSSSVPGVKRIGDEFSGTTGSWEESTTPAMSSVQPNPLSSQSQQSLDAQQATITPKFGMDGINKDTSTLGDTASRITNEGGLKTLNVAGGTISSRSSKFGNSTPEQLADLDRRLAMDRDPEVAARRAESAAMADQRYNDVLRGGLSRSEYENPTGSTQLMKSMLAAKGRGDVAGYKTYQKLLTEQLGNETTRAGQNITAENARLSGQSEAARLGQTQIKDQRDFEATQQNKGIDQSLEMQKTQANIDRSINEQYNNPTNMAASWSPSQSFEFVSSQQGNLGEHLGKIVGPQTAEEIKREPSLPKRAQRLQSLGLSPDQVKQLLMSLQQ